MKKSRLVILDANVVIDAHRENYWPVLVSRYSIHLPATVLRDEVFYFEVPSGQKPIVLTPLVERGHIIELEATVEEHKQLKALLNPTFFLGIDPGEKEALALLKSRRCKDFLFCTGDRLALKALGVLDLSSQGISVERLLELAGNRRKLKRHFTTDWMSEQIATGFQERESCLVGSKVGEPYGALLLKLFTR